MTENQDLSQWQRQVRGTSVINGFSYPLLRLLVNKARELQKTKKLITSQKGEHDRATGLGSVVLDQIARQIQGSWDVGGWEDLSTRNVDGLLEAAETFLAIFEEKTEKP